MFSRSAPAAVCSSLRHLVTLGLILVLGACASTRRFTISPEAGAVPGSSTAPLVQERKHRVSVQLLTPSFSERAEEIPAFDIRFENRGTAALSFSPANVSVYSGEGTVRAYTASELVALIEERSRREAEESTARQAEVFLQSAATGQDPSSAMARISSAKQANRAAELRDSREAQLREIVSLIVPVRVQPGETGSGVIKLRAEDILPGQPLKIEVSIDGQAYLFTFAVEPD